MNWKRGFPDNCFSTLKINNLRHWHTYGKEKSLFVWLASHGFSWLTVNDSAVAEMTELLQATELHSGFPRLYRPCDCFIDNVVFFWFRHVWKHAFNVHVPLFRYYDQLCAVEPKFPFSENQVIKLTSHVVVGWFPKTVNECVNTVFFFV